METRNKKLFIGVDEAGYGPNLGPLTISASVWEVDTSVGEADLIRKLAPHFAPKNWHAGCGHLPLGDSKKLYQSGAGLESLEAGLLSILSQSLQNNSSKPTDHGDFSSIRNLEDLLKTVCRSDLTASEQVTWYEGLDSLEIPACLERNEVQRLQEIASKAFQDVGVSVCELRAKVITESHFNHSVERLDSKGLVLSQATLELVAELFVDYPEMEVEVYCDRQGGRKNYLPVLADVFPELWFQEMKVSAERCSYQLLGDQRLKIHFSVGGDSFPPTALASMLAKYLRERLMEAFNAFWAKQLPELRPTAGYPQDAKRFRKDIAQVARRLKLNEQDWWRCR